MAHNFLWKIILGYVFIRPFISELTFGSLELIINSILIFISCIYISKYSFKITRQDKIIFIFLLCILSSLMFSKNILDGVIQFVKYTSLIMLYYSVKFSGSQKRQQLIYILLTSSFLVSLYSLHILFIISNKISELIPRYKEILPFAEELLGRKRAFSPFITPNLLANYLVMMLIFSLGLIFEAIKQRNLGTPQRDGVYLSGNRDTNQNKQNLQERFIFFMNYQAGLLLYLSCASINLLTLYFTKSLGGWLTFIFCMFVSFISGKMVRKKVLFVGTIITLTFCIIFLLRMMTNTQHATPIFSLFKRGDYWKETIQIILRHPLKGVGLGSFTLSNTLYAHNSYLQIWAEMGIVAIISWSWIVFNFLRQGLMVLRSRERNYFTFGIILSGIAFLIHNLFDFSFFISQGAYLFWIILGLMHQATHFSID